MPIPLGIESDVFGVYPWQPVLPSWSPNSTWEPLYLAQKLADTMYREQRCPRSSMAMLYRLCNASATMLSACLVYAQALLQLDISPESIRSVLHLLVLLAGHSGVAGVAQYRLSQLCRSSSLRALVLAELPVLEERSLWARHLFSQTVLDVRVLERSPADTLLVAFTRLDKVRLVDAQFCYS